MEYHPDCSAETSIVQLSAVRDNWLNSLDRVERIQPPSRETQRPPAQFENRYLRRPDSEGNRRALADSN